MSTPSAPQAQEVTSVLAGFKLTRILDQDPKTRTAVLLGEVPAGGGASNGGTTTIGATERAIVRLEKTHFEEAFFARLGDFCERVNGEGQEQAALKHFARLQSLGQNDIYNWLLGWRAELGGGADGAANPPADMKVNVIRPATDAHIRKYERQETVMIHETPEMYASVVQPWIESQPASRINWVYNILDGVKEKENVIYRNDDPKTGFVILPDLKWDQRTLSSLYLVAIVQDRSLRSVRDLRPAGDPQGSTHIALLDSIKREAERIARERYGLGLEGSSAQTQSQSKLRLFLHYHPSYYHLHVHILSADFDSWPGAIVGRAHALDDVRDLLALGVDFRKRTLAFSTGVRTEIYQALQARLGEVADNDGRESAEGEVKRQKVEHEKSV